MEEQRLAACAEKLKRLNEKHRQATEIKSAPVQPSADDTGAANEEVPSAPAPVSSPAPSIPPSQSQVSIIQTPLPERVDRDGERIERERVEPSEEEEAHLPRQPSPPVQRAVTVASEPQSEGETSVAEVGPLVEENQTDRTTAPMRDYFNMEDNRGGLLELLTLPIHDILIVTAASQSFSHRCHLTVMVVHLQLMSPNHLCLTWTKPAERKFLCRHHKRKEKRQPLCDPLSPLDILNSFKSLCHLVSSDSR